VQVLAALTEGVGINAVTRLYGVSKNSIYRWQERLSGLKKQRSGRRLKPSWVSSATLRCSCTLQCSLAKEGSYASQLA